MDGIGPYDVNVHSVEKDFRGGERLYHEEIGGGGTNYTTASFGKRSTYEISMIIAGEGNNVVRYRSTDYTNRQTLGHVRIVSTVELGWNPSLGRLCQVGAPQMLVTYDA